MNDRPFVRHCLFLAHGSPAPEAGQEFENLVQTWAGQNPRYQAHLAYLSIGSPNLMEGLRNCIVAGAESIEVIPLLLFSGKHLQQDIPAILQAFSQEFPSVQIHLNGPLSSQPGFVEFLSQNR